MDLKLAGFSGKSEDFPAWSTKFVALMHTKGLFRTVMGNDDLPEAEPTLPENPNADQMTAYNTKIQHQDAGASCADPAEERQPKHSVVTSSSGPEQHHTDVHQERLRGCGWLWRWDEGLETAAREVLQCGEAYSGQSSRPACEAAPRIRGGSR